MFDPHCLSKSSLNIYYLNTQNIKPIPLKPIIFIAGVSGTGKTTIGKALSRKTEIPFFDGDDYHSDTNISKMKAGIPLTDADRKSWLVTLNHLANKEKKMDGAIIACSALKEVYRKVLEQSHESNTKWVFLVGDMELIRSRMSHRKNHFMPTNILQSQFHTWEKPEYGLKINVTKKPQTIVDTIIKHYHLQQ